jgi:hypothetical protein
MARALTAGGFFCFFGGGPRRLIVNKTRTPRIMKRHDEPRGANHNV